MKMIEKASILRKFGFYRTLSLLSSDGSKIQLMEFYTKLNQTDYYNMFIRIKRELIRKEIISIERDSVQKRKTIRLTKNGIVLKLRIKEIISQLENPNLN